MEILKQKIEKSNGKTTCQIRHVFAENKNEIFFT